MKFTFKGVDFFPHDTRWKIIERRYIFVGLSWALTVVAAILLLTRGLNYGVDFKGGSLIEIQSKTGPIDIGALRIKLDKLGVGEVQVQAVGQGSEALIRVAQQEPTAELSEEKVQAVANDKVKAALGNSIEVRRTEVVGPTVSHELKRSGLIALVCSMLGIMLYVWFRFEWQFGVAAILALSHDVFITVGMFSLLWYEFDLSVVAAVLTLAGYSINDTVVVFDRIRENLRRYKRMPLIELLNLSINETLSRTVLTHVTTFLAMMPFVLVGGEAIFGFALAMVWGIVIGAYSSIYVAAPLQLILGVKRDGGMASTPARAKTQARARA